MENKKSISGNIWLSIAITSIFWVIVFSIIIFSIENNHKDNIIKLHNEYNKCDDEEHINHLNHLEMETVKIDSSSILITPLN